jgi:hypothetical protein
MNRERISTYLVVCSLAVVFHPVQGVAQQNADPSKAASRPERDGQHDFDFEFGSCKIHLNKLMHPLTGSTKWVEFDGTSVTRKVWDGGAQLEQFETDRPAAAPHRGPDAAYVQSSISSVEARLGQQQDWNHGPAPSRRIPQWTR